MAGQGSGREKHTDTSDAGASLGGDLRYGAGGPKTRDDGPDQPHVGAPAAAIGVPSGLLERFSAAAFVLDTDGRITSWSPAAGEFFGCAAAEAVGKNAVDLLAAAEHHAWFSEWLDRAVAGAGWSGTLPVSCGDGALRETAFHHVPLNRTTGRRVEILVLASEASWLRRLEMDLALSRSLVDTSPVGLGMVDGHLRWLRINRALAGFAGLSPGDLVGHSVERLLTSIDLPEAETALRKAVETRETAPERHVTARPLGHSEGELFLSMLTYPVEDSDGSPLGAAIELLDITERERATADIAHARDHLAVVAEAGTRIGTSLDVTHTAWELADLAVPRLADLAAVDILESVLNSGVVPSAAAAESERFRAVAMAPDDSERYAPIAQLGNSVTSYAPHRLINRTVTEAQPLLMAEMDTESLRRMARDEETAEALSRVGAHSFLAVPLLARGRAFGTLSLCRTDNPRPFDAHDLELAQELASRAAVSVDNARLYSRERNAALTLQRGLLPESPAAPPGFELAARYLPAVREVGGDWFDILPLGEGRTGLMVGDVMGKGVHAAAIMGQLRSTTRALARLNLPAAELLEHLDDTADFLGESIATCVLAVCDVQQEWCEVATAGHPPPVLVNPGGHAELLDLPVGVPLGTRAGGYRAVRRPLPEGATLALYTDGLIEDRQAPIDAGIARLMGLLAGPKHPLEEVCDRVLAGLHQQPEDDVALLLARRGAAQPSPPAIPSG